MAGFDLLRFFRKPVSTPVPAAAKTAPPQDAPAVPSSAGAPAQTVIELQKKANRALTAGDVDTAERAFRDALALDATYAPAWLGLGFALLDVRPEDARRAFQRLIGLQPDSRDGYYFLGVLAQGDRADPAIEWFTKALEIDPGFLPALQAVLPLLLNAGQADRALAIARHALSVSDGLPVRLLVAECLGANNRYDEALAEFEAVLTAQPGQIEGLLGKARCLVALGLNTTRSFAPPPDEATEHPAGATPSRGLEPFAQAAEIAHTLLRVQPELAEAHLLMGMASWEMGDGQRALIHLSRAHELDVGLAQADLTQFAIHFSTGQYRQAWPLFESRFAIARSAANLDLIVFRRLLSARRWDGSAHPNDTLYIWCEQGFGDSLMMFRMLPLAMERFRGAVHLYCPGPLTQLASQLIAPERIVNDVALIPLDAWHCPLMSLPFVLEAFDRPVGAPYLSAPPQAAALREPAVSDDLGLKVGLAWRGSLGFGAAALRDIDPKALLPLFDIADVTFYNFQKDATAAELSVFPVALVQQMQQVHTFADSAVLLHHLDLLITVDSAPAHLAGALGRPVWLLNRASSEWRWSRNRADSDWYDSMRIFNQTQRGDWTSVVAELGHALRTATAEQARRMGTPSH